MADNTQEKYILLAVNGTLMRGLELEGNLREAGAEFGFEARTEVSERGKRNGYFAGSSVVQKAWQKECRRMFHMRQV